MIAKTRLVAVPGSPVSPIGHQPTRAGIPPTLWTDGACSSLLRVTISALFCLIIYSVSAQPLLQEINPSPPGQLTAKERLTSKAADQQRVNDCNVPIELRGDSRRPADCAHLGRPPTAGSRPAVGSTPAAGQRRPKE